MLAVAAITSMTFGTILFGYSFLRIKSLDEVCHKYPR